MSPHFAPLFGLLLFATQAPQVVAADLTVRIENIRSADGHILLLAADSDAAWNGADKPAASHRVPADADGIEIVLGDLEPGRYAIQVMHDANGNGKLDSNVVGMPIEGYGFSNNPQLMRKATFEEAAFDLPEAGIAIAITLN